MPLPAPPLPALPNFWAFLSSNLEAFSFRSSAVGNVEKAPRVFVSVFPSSPAMDASWVTVS